MLGARSVQSTRGHGLIPVMTAVTWFCDRKTGVRISETSCLAQGLEPNKTSGNAIPTEALAASPQFLLPVLVAAGMPAPRSRCSCLEFFSEAPYQFQSSLEWGARG